MRQRFLAPFHPISFPMPLLLNSLTLADPSSLFHSTPTHRSAFPHLVTSPGPNGNTLASANVI